MPKTPANPSPAEALVIVAVEPGEGRPADEDVPPLHVLEARERRDRRETEELLAGFDRPARGPNRGGSKADVLGLYVSRPGPTAPRDPLGAEDTSIPSVPTGVLPRTIGKKLVVAASLVMLVGGAIFAYAATRPSSARGGSALPTSATLARARDRSYDEVPPPPPAQEPAGDEAAVELGASREPAGADDRAGDVHRGGGPSTALRRAPGGTVALAEHGDPARGSRLGPTDRLGSSEAPARRAPAKGSAAPATATASASSSGAEPKLPERDDFLREM